MPVWLRGFANLLDQAGISLCGNGFAYIFYISHRQHPGVIRSAAVAYAGFFVIWSTGYKIRFPNRTRLLSALLPSGSEFPVRFHCSPRADGEFRNLRLKSSASNYLPANHQSIRQEHWQYQPRHGYQKDPDNHTKLIVDELAAETVQNIFRWKINGVSNQGIADRLNAEKVPSPAARKLQSGAKLSLHFRKSDEPPWSAKAVDRILHNEVYTGKLVQGKTRRLDYRSKKKMNVPMRDWTIVDNTHEAIVPAEQFELVFSFQRSTGRNLYSCSVRL